MLTFTGIKRKEKYSPNHITNDALIMEKTAEELEKFNFECRIIDETELESEFNITSKLIFSMARGEKAGNRLLNLADDGLLIINSGRAVLNCYRVNMIKLLQDAGVNFPFSRVVTTENTNINYSLDDFNSHKIWIKRGDVHAVHREDVSLVYSNEEMTNLLKEFSTRGIKEAVLQEHLDGDVVKFYCVKDTSFFYWYYLNGKNHAKFDLDELKKYATNSARALGLEILGGDAIISPEGQISIIDVNDWPSFAPIRDEASKIIAYTIHNKALNFYDKVL